VKVDEVHDCESDYHCDQAETEDVTNIVPGYARTSAFSILLVGTDTPISLLIFRCYLVWHEILFSPGLFLKRLQMFRQRMYVTGRGVLFSRESVCPNASDKL
jgi:hypothetical protein